MSEFAEIKKWLDDTADEPLEEMGSFFAARVEGYEEHMSPWQAYYQWMAELIHQGAKTLLDIGCGTGLELDEIFRLQPQIAVTGIDLEPAMLERLREKHGHRNLRLIEGDYFQIPFESGYYDVAVSFETLHHFKPEKKLVIFRKLYESLKEGGCYLEADYVAESEEMEEYLFAECERRRAKSGIGRDVFVHFDTPLTLEHEMGLLREAGFARVEFLGYHRDKDISHRDKSISQGENHTPMIRAVK